MAALDIAGVIGTWVAAFIAIVALVGIIGPILIWRASRTERHKALAAAANTDNEFITKGIHAGPNIWLLQRVKAPLLKTATVLIDSTFVLDPNAFKEVTVGTTWVSLGHLIKAYGVTYSRGDSLEILRDRAYLPVHKIWLLAIGLIGRYGERKDRGKFRSTKRVVRLSTPSASHRVGRTGLIKDGLFIPDRAQKIHGVTGSFEAIYTPGDGFPRFASASKEDLHQQLPDVLAPKTLFKMASGLMPLWDGRFFSLVESSFDNDSLDQFSSDSDANGLADMRAHRRNNRGVYISRPSKKRAPEYFRPHGPTNRRENLLHDGPRAHQLLPASDRDSGMTAMARCFAADQDEVLVLDPARDSHSLSVMLKEHNGRTYVPAESPWIRLPEIRVDDQYSDAQEIVHVSRAGEMAYYHAPVYVNRADTQEMAYSLLEMEWHPENYSIESSKFSVGMRLLGWAGRSLSRVGDRIVDIISNIGLGALEQSKLAQSLEPALRRLEKSGSPDRSISSILYNLDKTL